MALSDYVTAVLASSPRAYWKLDEASGLPQDSSGNALHMTSQTGGVKTYGVGGPLPGFTAMQFEGGYGVSRSAVSTQQDDITFEAWIRPQIISANDQTAMKNSSASQGWDVVFDTNRTYQVIVQGVAAQSSGSALTLGLWRHVVVTRRAGTWLYFLDGAADGTGKGTSTPNGSPASTGIGGSSSFQFRVCHVAYYETSLSDADITAHYDAALSGFSFMPTTVTQQAAEVVVAPTTAAGRTTQEAVEAVVLPTTAKGRVTQDAVEVVAQEGNPMGRVTQEYVEVALGNEAVGRVTQEYVEAAVTDTVDGRVTQQYIEAAVADDVAGRVTQQYAEVVLGNERVAHITQQYVEVAYSYGRPTFIPRVWAWF